MLFNLPPIRQKSSSKAKKVEKKLRSLSFSPSLPQLREHPSPMFSRSPNRTAIVAGKSSLRRVFSRADSLLFQTHDDCSVRPSCPGNQNSLLRSSRGQALPVTNCLQLHDSRLFFHRYPIKNEKSLHNGDFERERLPF